MSRRLFSRQTSQIVQRINPDVQLYVEDGVGLQVAPSLRKLSQDLRETSQTLRWRNLEVMKRADEVAVRCYEIALGEF